jgi:hypothetical protein
MRESAKSRNKHGLLKRRMYLLSKNKDVEFCYEWW